MISYKMISRFNNERVLAYFIGIVYTVQTLNFFRFYPSKRNLDLGLQALIALSIGMILILTNKEFKFNKIGIAVFGWLFLLLILIIQPVVNHIIYPDSLFLTIVPIIFLILLSLIIYQVNDKIAFTKILAVMLTIAGLLQLLTIFAQRLNLDFLYGTLVYPLDKNGDAVGNVGQRNQAAFILALAITSTYYVGETILSKKSFKVAFQGIVIFLLSLGIALTSSRGGLILGLLSILGYFILVDKNFRIKLKQIASYSIIFVIGNILGTLILKASASNIANNNSRTVVERINDYGIAIRGYQIEQSWLAFKDNPVLGLGWEQFITSVLPYREQLRWISVADHTHFIPAQIAVELGSLGLLVFLPFIWLAWKRISFKCEEKSAYILTVLAIFTAYSFSEFPLWYFNYLMIFVVFVTLLENNFMQLKLNSKVPRYISLGLLLLALPIGMSYYKNYMTYSKVYGAIVYGDLTPNQSLKLINALPNTYGFLDYKEYMLFRILPINTQQLDEKIALGNRVIQMHPEPELLMRLGLIYGLKSDKEASVELFKTACRFEYSQFCDQARDNLAQAKIQQPVYYEDIYNQFVMWEKNRQ